MKDIVKRLKRSKLWAGVGGALIGYLEGNTELSIASLMAYIVVQGAQDVMEEFSKRKPDLADEIAKAVRVEMGK